MTRHNPLMRVQDMLDHARRARDATCDINEEDFGSDFVRLMGIVKIVEIIGEAAGRVSEDIRLRYPEVPWRDVSDLRNRLVHGYNAVNFARLWTIIKEDIPPLIRQLENILAEEA